MVTIKLQQESGDPDTPCTDNVLLEDWMIDKASDLYCDLSYFSAN